jgi:flagellar P-ring protein precursor FlgI
MRRVSFRAVLTVLLMLACTLTASANSGIRIKDLGRIDGLRENMVVGYGIVTGVAGSGDSSRSQATLQSVANALKEFGVAVTAAQLSSRNVAAVLVTATLPAFVHSGDKLDVSVSSLGDARSLVGGTLLMTPLYGPDRKIYALAQGSLSVGGYKFDQNGNVVQKNHPTSGIISEGALVEVDVTTRVVSTDGAIHVLLFSPDYTTASRMAFGINENMKAGIATALDAGRVEIKLPEDQQGHLVDFIARLETILVEPDQRARVIINERTGTVVSGGDVRLSKVSVTHGDLRVSIVTDYLVSQPDGFLVRPGSGVRTEVVPSTRIDVKEGMGGSVSLSSGATVGDLVAALGQIKTTTRDIINVLQSIKRAGALHAELIIQ